MGGAAGGGADEIEGPGSGVWFSLRRGCLGFMHGQHQSTFTYIHTRTIHTHQTKQQVAIARPLELKIADSAFSWAYNLLATLFASVIRGMITHFCFFLYVCEYIYT